MATPWQPDNRWAKETPVKMSDLKALEKAIRQDLPSEDVFERVVCLDWYDGPLSGMLAFREEPSEFRFDMVDNACVLDYRVFRIAPLPPGTIERFTNLLAQHGHVGTPRWPIWFPIWHFPSDADRSQASAATQQMTRAASVAVAAFCWDFAENRISAYRLIGPSGTPPEDWFSWLGLVRPGERLDINFTEDC